MRFSVVTMLLLAAVAANAQTMKVNNFKTLAVIYRGDPGSADYMDDAQVELVKNGFELGRAFYFRNSLARFNVELVWMLIDTPAPENAGPTYEHMEADLAQRGVKPGQYDGLITTGVGMMGNWGGFNVFDGTCACFGGGGVQGNLTWYPEDKPNVGYGWGWIFAHEFQHAVDLVAVPASNLEMLHAHPYCDRTDPFFQWNYQGGEHWDWIALTFREFHDWLGIKGVTNEILEVTDADGDGMPDDDPRLPMDEKRFGSDPTTADTDSDGLDDLHEFAADRYRGSDPRKADTDGDGVPDGEDVYPVVAMQPMLHYGNTIEDTQLLIDSVFARTDQGGDCQVKAAWNEDQLFLRFVAPRPFTALVKIDGSAANGFWEGGDTYLLKITNGKVQFDGLGLSGDVPGATTKETTVDGSYTLDVTLPAKIGQGVSKEINYGGQRDPEDVVDGLTLTAGRSIGFNFILEFNDKTRAALTPLHTIYGTRLVKPADAPERVMLRGPERTNAALPVVEVMGIGAETLVRVMQGDRVRGQRIGTGPVTLFGLNADGTYELRAKTDGGESQPIALVIDRTAEPPKAAKRYRQKITQEGIAVGKQEIDSLLFHCEPEAQVELWEGLDGIPMMPLSGCTVKADGFMHHGVRDSKLIDGWLVRAYVGQPFEKQVFLDGWLTINKLFEGGAPDPRLPADDFSLVFEGYLMVDRPGQYTFELECDDGGRVFIDDELVVNNWGHHGMLPRSGRIFLDSGAHRIMVRYYEEDGWAGVKLRFAPPGEPFTYGLPVRRSLKPLKELQLFARQIDVLGNVSDFAEMTIEEEVKRNWEGNPLRPDER
ncbi:MAG: hypothetical protein JXO22_05210 [Phycisphaerae bacterium]|nr:hypothetical protein [Phycisphaerae bacterium]